MNNYTQLLLIGTVIAVGVLHTMVPDHWVPIAVLARQKGWSKLETAGIAFKAGIGHVLTTLFIAFVVWGAGVVVATRFGGWVDTASSIALITFGGWFAFSSWRGLRSPGGHGHPHHHHPHQEKHEHRHEHEGHTHSHLKANPRTALILILGSSPMVEVIPTFFAAGKYGWAQIAVMSLVLAVSTIAAYVSFCVLSTLGLKRVNLGPLERYGEVLSGLLIAGVGIVFWIWNI